jgi:hypothetical protein
MITNDVRAESVQDIGVVPLELSVVLGAGDEEGIDLMNPEQ